MNKGKIVTHILNLIKVHKGKRGIIASKKIRRQTFTIIIFIWQKLIWGGGADENVIHNSGLLFLPFY